MRRSAIIGETKTYLATIDKENPSLAEKKEVKWAYQIDDGPTRFIKALSIEDGHVDDKGRIAITIPFDEAIFGESLTGKTMTLIPYLRTPNETREEAKGVIDILNPLTTHYIYYPFGIDYKGYPVVVKVALATEEAYTEMFGFDELQHIDWKDFNPASNRFLGEFEATDAAGTNPGFWGGIDMSTEGEDKIFMYEGVDAQYRYKHTQDLYRGKPRPKTDPEPCCDGIKKFFSEVLHKSWGKITRDFDPYSDSYWYGDDGYTYFVTDKDEFYKITFDGYEKVDELPPMQDYIELMLPSTAAAKGITIMGGKAGKATMVYFAKQGAKIIYVGITNNFARRKLEHLRKANGFLIKQIDDTLNSLSRYDAKAVEQVLIDNYRLGGKIGQTGRLFNKINSISHKNPIYKKAYKRGVEILEEIGFKFE